jgi:hypothetical protein
MLVSSAILARDEAAQIGDCLDSVAPFVDETVVLAAGSSDRTAELAEEHGARLVDAPWPGSFAAARNLAADACRGRWILRLDADTRASGQPEAFREALAAATSGLLAVRYVTAGGTPIWAPYLYQPGCWRFAGAAFVAWVPARFDTPAAEPGHLDEITLADVGRPAGARAAHLRRYLELESAAAADGSEPFPGWCCVQAGWCAASLAGPEGDDSQLPAGYAWLDEADRRRRASTSRWPPLVAAHWQQVFNQAYTMLLDAETARAR